MTRAFGLCCLLLVLASCGYHVGGKADEVPQNIQTIAIPAFATSSSRYKLVDALPDSIAREFLTRTRFKVTTDPQRADAVLTGAIVSAFAYPNVNDPNTGVSISVRVVIVISVRLVDRTSGKELYSNPRWVMHQDYAAAADPHQLFDESGPAFDRLCRDVSRDLVSAVVENF